MINTGVGVFDKTLQKSGLWLDDLSHELGWEDRRRTYRALRVAMQTLRDRLPVSEAVQLGAQLPMLIRGMYYEGWNPSATPNKELNKQEFLATISRAFSDQPDFEAERVCSAVFKTIEKHISAGESADIQAVLPRRLSELWAAAGRT